MRGHVEVDYATPVVGQHQEHVKDLETDRRHREEVDDFGILIWPSSAFCFGPPSNERVL
jgi:hypothetical protein